MFSGEGRVLFVDDDPALRAANSQSLELAGLTVDTFENASDALARIESDFNGVIVSDIRMPGIDGLEFFQRMRALDPQIPFILITGHGDVAMAVAALKDGAHDFLAKPFAPDHLIATVKRGLAHRQLELDNRRLRALADSDSGDSPLLGETPAMIRLRETISQVAPAAIDVLIEGETGVGKELVARLLHRLGPRRGGSFTAVNCGALPGDQAERVLFGDESVGGARISTGRVEAASRGTLFLDEIDSMPIEVQIKMLRVLEEREVIPIGAREPRAVDLRVVAAAKRDLESAVRDGSFREDLLYRINMVRLRIPPLRERRADIPLLFAHFTREAAQQMRREPPPLADRMRRYLVEHDWPGNVRELRNFAFRSTLGVDDQQPGTPPAHEAIPLPRRVDRFEASVIESVLDECRGNVGEALERLGIPRKTFYDKLARHGIDIKSYRH